VVHGRLSWDTTHDSRETSDDGAVPEVVILRRRLHSTPEEATWRNHNQRPRVAKSESKTRLVRCCRLSCLSLRQ